MNHTIYMIYNIINERQKLNGNKSYYKIYILCVYPIFYFHK